MILFQPSSSVLAMMMMASTAVLVDASGCCSHNYKSCVNWCGNTPAECNSSPQFCYWLDNGRLDSSCKIRWSTGCSSDSDCCDGLTCQQFSGWSQCNSYREVFGTNPPSETTEQPQTTTSSTTTSTSTTTTEEPTTTTVSAIFIDCSCELSRNRTNLFAIDHDDSDNHDSGANHDDFHNNNGTSFSLFQMHDWCLRCTIHFLILFRLFRQPLLQRNLPRQRKNQP